MATYTVGKIITGVHGYAATYPRPLYRDGVQIAVVDCNAGPVVMGEMGEDQARLEFPEVFRDQ